jgi:dihydroflavonol-4-reductase
MIFITGGTGLVGSHIVSELLSRKQQVCIFSRSKNAALKLEKLIRVYHTSPKELIQTYCTFVQGDVLDYEVLKQAMQGCNFAIHAAAMVSFVRNDFSEMMYVNRYGTANFINASTENSIERILYISSTSAIGSDSINGDSIKRESNAWNANEKTSGYGITKYSAEKEVWRGFEEGLNGVLVNPSVVFGPGNWDESSLKILRTLKSGLNYYTSGANGFVDARDVAFLSIELLFSNLNHERFLLVGENTSFRELFKTISKSLNVTPPKKLATIWQTTMAWRLEGIKCFLSGKTPTITKESARAAHEITVFSNEKILKEFPNFSFNNLVQMIEFAVRNRLN